MGRLGPEAGQEGVRIEAMVQVNTVVYERILKMRTKSGSVAMILLERQQWIETTSSF